MKFWEVVWGGGGGLGFRVATGEVLGVWGSGFRTVRGSEGSGVQLHGIFNKPLKFPCKGNRRNGERV